MRTLLVAATILVAGFALAAANAPAPAETDAQAPKPLALRSIMKELGRNMQVITDGISREDWALIEKTAPRVADHPQPPMSERLRILAFAGTDAGRFKAYDGETNMAAEALAKGARAKDGEVTILAFQKLQSSCFNCHREFRKPFVEHFYGAQ
ncbi:MAG: cytochrome c [Planctomycetes bacterium]|nr:cytochrome c [Planctomycetota bacterium]